MKSARIFLLVLAFVGFIFSLTVHLLSLLGRVPTSASWFVGPCLGALVSFVLAPYLSGTKVGRMGVSIKEIVKGCPTWLRRTEYFFSAYVALVMVWLAFRSPGVFPLGKVELPARAAFVVFSAVSTAFYVSTFSMLFGKLFGEEYQDCSSSRAAQKTT
jgi:hypothetical protein